MFIELEEFTGGNVVINTNHVVSVVDCVHLRFVQTTMDGFQVKETYEEIIEKLPKEGR